MKLMAIANASRKGYQPVPICLAHTEVVPSYESLRWFRRVWVEAADGTVVKVVKDNLTGDAKMQAGQPAPLAA